MLNRAVIEFPLWSREKYVREKQVLDTIGEAQADKLGAIFCDGLVTQEFTNEVGKRVRFVWVETAATDAPPVLVMRRHLPGFVRRGTRLDGVVTSNQSA